MLLEHIRLRCSAVRIANAVLADLIAGVFSATDGSTSGAVTVTMGATASELSQQQQAALSLAPPSPFTATAPLTSTASTHVSPDTQPTVLTLKGKGLLLCLALWFKSNTRAHIPTSVSLASSLPAD